MSSLSLSVSSSLRGLLRDLNALTGGLRGRRLPPFSPRDGSAWGAVPLRRRRLRVAELRRDSPDSVLLTLEDPSGAPLLARPGQFLTLIVTLGGQELRRAYSLCGPPGSVQLCVKRVAGGLVSNHLVDHAAPGMWVQVLGPSGDFGLSPDPSAQRRLLLLSGGSGVTPNAAIAQAVLAQEPKSQVWFFIGDRSLDAALLRPELQALAQAHPQRLVLRRVLEQAAPGHSEGRLDAQGLDTLLGPEGLPEGVQAYVCGPEPMMQALVQALADRGLPPDRVQLERFTPGARLRQDDPRLSQPWPVTLRVGGEERSLRSRPGQTLLETALTAGINLPYSCAMGGCGACKLRLREGELQHREPNCLGPEEPGAALSCCAFPLSPVTLELP